MRDLDDLPLAALAAARARGRLERHADPPRAARTAADGAGALRLRLVLRLGRGRLRGGRPALVEEREPLLVREQPAGPRASGVLLIIEWRAAEAVLVARRMRMRGVVVGVREGGGGAHERVLGRVGREAELELEPVEALERVEAVEVEVEGAAVGMPVPVCMVMMRMRMRMQQTHR